MKIFFVLLCSGMFIHMPYKDAEKRKEYAREAARRWRAENPEAAREKARLDAAKFRTKNPAKVLATNRAWYAKNLEKARAIGRERQARYRARKEPVVKPAKKPIAERAARTSKASTTEPKRFAVAMA